MAAPIHAVARVLGLAAVVLVLAPQAALALPRLEPTDETDPAAAPVVEWLTTSGPGVIASAEGTGLSPEQLAEVEAGSPVRVSEWTPRFVAGDPTADAVRPLDQWVAPLVLDDTGVGALHVVLADGSVSTHYELWDAELGRALVAYPEATYIVEAGTNVWFRISSNTLSPASMEARQLLAGSMGIEEYQPFLVARFQAQSTPAVPSESQETNRTPVIVTAAIMGALLGIAGILAWIRHPEGNE